MKFVFLALFLIIAGIFLGSFFDRFVPPPGPEETNEQGNELPVAPTSSDTYHPVETGRVFPPIKSGTFKGPTAPPGESFVGPKENPPGY